MLSIKIFILSACLSCILAQSCEYRAPINYKINFARSNTSYYPRVYALDSIPRVTEFTACARVRPCLVDGKEEYTIFSFASTCSDNEFRLTMLNPGSSDDSIIEFTVYIGGQMVTFVCYDYEYYSETYDHVCVTWFSCDGSTRLYLDGNRCYNVNTGDDVAYLYEGNTVGNNGVLVIGQDQDSVDGSYDYTQAFYGDIIDPHIWDEQFNSDQIYSAGSCYEDCRPIKPGNIFGFLGSSISATDGVTFKPTKYCS